MKNLYQILFALIITALLFACRKDEFTDVNGDITPIGDVTTIVEANLTGVVLDANEQPIEGAQILASGAVATTDVNGVFRFINIDLISNGSLIKIKKEGYFDGFQFANSLPGQNGYKETILIKKEPQSFDSNLGGTLETNGGSTITFQANSIMDANGTNYQGEVLVNAHWYDPSSEETFYAMPGDLRGIDLNNQMVQLLSYGMMAVELSTPTGEELQLSAENTATLKFAIPDGSNASDFSTIPTWHLDEETGIWIEEGEAIIEADFITAEVSHFSFWNCDFPFPMINIQGTLINQTGQPLPFQKVLIQDENNNLSQSGFTNESGFFSGNVPEGVDLRMSTFYCDQNMLISSLGVLTTNEDFGNLSLEGVINTDISASLTGCDLQPITDGYLKLTTTAGTKILSPNSNGMISYQLLDCNEIEATVVGYDLNNLKNSDPITISLDQASIDLETINICGEITDDFVSIFIDDTALATIFEEIEVKFADDQILYITAFQENVMPTLAPSTLLIKYDLGENKAQYICSGYDADDNRISTEGEDLAMNVSTFSTAGDLITLSFDNGAFRGNIQVNLDQVVESGMVSGMVWMDDNQNGIREAGEFPIIGKTISIRPNSGFSSSYYPIPLGENYTVITDSAGNFTFEGILVDEEHVLNYFGEPGEQISPANIGDDSLDSDFLPGSSADFYTTDFFLVEEGGEYINFGLGILQ